MQVIPIQKPAATLRDRAVKEKLQELRPTDNWTNWLYLARAWGLILLSMGGVIAFSQAQMAYEWSFAWNLPVWFLAVVVIGASQHQLAACTHEATHYILFRNRLLNELVSDLLCMFPLFSSTAVFRMHHLAHHQYINDPEHDPDYTQLQASGHWLRFPIQPGRMITFLLWQATLIPLVRYILVRARFNSLGVDHNPYIDRSEPRSPWVKRLALIHVFTLLALTLSLSLVGPLWAVIAVPVVWTLALLGLVRSIRASGFLRARLPQVIEPRTIVLLRVAFIGVLFGGLGLAAHLWGFGVWVYFFALWVVPIFTTFSLFMILRQLVQHGNGDRGLLTNSRTFLIEPFLRYAVFPMGMDYHLPHHMYATVPHYNLPRLHAFLMTIPEYRDQAVVVEGYFASPHRHEPRPPTVVEVLGPAYHQEGTEVHIDDSVVNLPEPENGRT